MSCCDIFLGTGEQIVPQKPAEPAAFAVEAGQWELSHDSLHREEFEQWVLKVAQCPLKQAHDWSSCPYLHEGETKARRRCPRKYAYTSIACPSMKQEGFCPLGDTCPFAHNDFEYWLHHTRYHTSLCKKGERCDRKFCFFAHLPCELRKPAERPKLPPGSMAAAAVLRRPQRERSGRPCAALAAARQRARLAAAVGPAGVAGGPLALGSLPNRGSSQESSGSSSAGGMREPGAGAWERGYSGAQGMAPLQQQQQMPAGGISHGREHAHAAEGAYASLLTPAAASAVGALPSALHLSFRGAPAFPLSPFEAPVQGSSSPPQPATPSSLVLESRLGLNPGSLEQSGSFCLQEMQRGLSNAVAVEEAGREVLKEVASELFQGRIDAGTAISIVDRILGSPALTQLSAVLEAQAQELSAAAAPAPAAQALGWAFASGLAPASGAAPALPVQALLQAQHAQQALHGSQQSVSWDAAASALASGQLAGAPMHPCGAVSPTTLSPTAGACLAPKQAAGNSFGLGQITRAGAAGSWEVLPGPSSEPIGAKWGSPGGPTAHELASLLAARAFGGHQD